MKPLPPRDFDAAAARHLLNRAGYGGTPAQLRQLAAMGLDAAVDHLVDYDDHPALPGPDLDADVIRKRTAEERQRISQAKKSGDQDHLDAVRKQQSQARRDDRKQFQSLQQWWLGRMAQTPRPLEERLTFFWHGHFASSQRSVRDSYLMYAQNAMLREHARGRFDAMVAAVVHDPAMLKYLNNDRNIAKRPNENLARELMELFTLGVGNYTEDDIKEVARALTGYGVDDNDFVLNKRRHDGGEKKILGQTGPFDGASVAALLAAHPACPRFIALKLYDYFVADVGDVYEKLSRRRAAAVDSLTAVLRKENLHIGRTLKHLFKSRHFYDNDVVGKKIKSPVQLLVGTVRSLGTPTREAKNVLPALTQMGQVPFLPPTVDGWDGGRAWINTSTLFVRQNYTTYLATGLDAKAKPKSNSKKRRKNKAKAATEPAYRPTTLLAHLSNPSPQAAADALIDHALGPHTPSARRVPLHDLANELLADGLADAPLARLIAAIAATPEYQLC